MNRTPLKLKQEVKVTPISGKLKGEKRLTSSVFGDIMSRSENNNSPSLTKRLLDTNFGGNAYTRKGLMEEENTRKEYKLLTLKLNKTN